jgi:hypothetical protein
MVESNRNSNNEILPEAKVAKNSSKKKGIKKIVSALLIINHIEGKGQE